MVRAFLNNAGEFLANLLNTAGYEEYIKNFYTLIL